MKIKIKKGGEKLQERKKIANFACAGRNAEARSGEEQGGTAETFDFEAFIRADS